MVGLPSKYDHQKQGLPYEDREPIWGLALSYHSLYFFKRGWQLRVVGVLLSNPERRLSITYDVLMTECVMFNAYHLSSG